MALRAMMAAADQAEAAAAKMEAGFSDMKKMSEAARHDLRMYRAAMLEARGRAEGAKRAAEAAARASKQPLVEPAPKPAKKKAAKKKAAKKKPSKRLAEATDKE